MSVQLPTGPDAIGGPQGYRADRAHRTGARVFDERFELSRQLGGRATGAVWLAHDRSRDRDVALKFLPETVAANPRAMEELRRSVIPLLRADGFTWHPTHVALHDLVTDAGAAAISMDVVDGRDLASLLATRPSRRFRPEEIAHWIAMLCDGLDNAHRCGILHLDLNPSDVMVARDGAIRILNFGIGHCLARWLWRVEAQETSPQRATPFMSPRRLADEPGSAADDAYSVAAIILHLLGGRLAPCAAIDGGQIPAAWKALLLMRLRHDVGTLVRWSVSELRHRLLDPPDESVLSPVEPARHPRDAGFQLPFENSLGMRFLPVPGTDVLFSVWPTRVQDFRRFVEVTGHDTGDEMFVVNGSARRTMKGHGWHDPGFEQSPEHPVVGVDLSDATAFCQWLSREEGLPYRLPTDAEWSAAVGPATYPWGTGWPPPSGAGNYAGSESGSRRDWHRIEEYSDDFPHTSPVGSFAPNPLGLFDLGGNVWEMCASIDGEDGTPGLESFRGACWADHQTDSIESRMPGETVPDDRNSVAGFRVVLERPTPALI